MCCAAHARAWLRSVNWKLTGVTKDAASGLFTLK
jgi:hypothetical protein